MKPKKREVKDVRFAEPQVRHADAELDATRTADAEEAAKPDLKLLWPEGVERPKFYRPGNRMPPCPECNHLLRDPVHYAVSCDRGVSRKSGKAYLTCTRTACGHVFTMQLDPEWLKQWK